MPNFNVTITRKEELTTSLEIEAEDEDDAIRIAEGKVRDLNAGIIKVEDLEWEDQNQTFEVEEVLEDA